MQRDSIFDSKKSDLKLLEASLMERIEVEDISKKELEESFMANINNTVGDISANISRETAAREDIIAELKDVLEVWKHKR